MKLKLSVLTMLQLIDVRFYLIAIRNMIAV